MLFHFKSELHDAPLYYFSSIGYGGVDIFLFLSGFGLLCGFDKNNRIKRFYLKRFIRIYPIYLFIIIVASILAQEYNPILIFVKSLGIGYYLQFITNDNWYEWYIPTILLFYLLFLLIYKKSKISVLKWEGGNDRSWFVPNGDFGHNTERHYYTINQ